MYRGTYTSQRDTCMTQQTWIMNLVRCTDTYLGSGTALELGPTKGYVAE